MSHLIQLNLKGGFKYWASLQPFECDGERWSFEWLGLINHASTFKKREQAEEWLKEIEAVQGHLTLKIVEI